MHEILRGFLKQSHDPRGQLQVIRLGSRQVGNGTGDGCVVVYIVDLCLHGTFPQVHATKKQAGDPCDQENKDAHSPPAAHSVA